MVAEKDDSARECFRYELHGINVIWIEFEIPSFTKGSGAGRGQGGQLSPAQG